MSPSTQILERHCPADLASQQGKLACRNIYGPIDRRPFTHRLDGVGTWRERDRWRLSKFAVRHPLHCPWEVRSHILITIMASRRGEHVSDIHKRVDPPSPLMLVMLAIAALTKSNILITRLSVMTEIFHPKSRTQTVCDIRSVVKLSIQGAVSVQPAPLCTLSRSRCSTPRGFRLLDKKAFNGGRVGHWIARGITCITGIQRSDFSHRLLRQHKSIEPLPNRRTCSVHQCRHPEGPYNHTAKNSKCDIPVTGPTAPDAMNGNVIFGS